MGETPHAAATTSLIVVGASALVGMVGHLRAGRVRLIWGLVFGLVGIGGSFLGSMSSQAIPGNVLLLAFSGLILVAAWRLHRCPAETPCHAAQHSSARTDIQADAAPASTHGPDSARSTRSPDHAKTAMGTVVRVVIAGTVVGFLTGFFGVGGGFVVVPALVLALGYQMPVAVGTSLLVIAISSAEGLFFHLSSGAVDWAVAIPFTAAGIAGVLLGDAIAARAPAARLTAWFVWLMLAVAIYTAAQSVMAA
ncbi:sulfite exporter TauE/SafE family protein [Candidatus Mycobacterium methanotrophicum]|uniref:Probable membrane transporter protein n=1 Tax=Candidatus Mycobacterium methanotrophicum TaxID=2943498 RepID=A0ABY4QN57_9MYCO|nr:sulfite exporter TauE/SafE family protein [Candidatus Mycobacterium methanotrophicum]UQX11286.1 sulfite exporter TauE/SafE family protein [Candidatus Mycobacterium methanotrophicum]